MYLRVMEEPSLAEVYVKEGVLLKACGHTCREINYMTTG